MRIEMIYQNKNCNNNEFTKPYPKAKIMIYQCTKCGYPNLPDELRLKEMN